MECNPTVIGRYSPPIASGVVGFSFPIYCIVESIKGKRKKHVYISWQPVKTKGKFSCALELKRWDALAWLPKKLKESAKSIVSKGIAPVSNDQISVIGRHQRLLWTNAFKERKPVVRSYDRKRKRRIAVDVKGKQVVMIPTCTPDEVIKGVKKGVRSESAVVLDSGRRSQKLMLLKDGRVISVPKAVVLHNDTAKKRTQFAIQHAQWGTRYCSCNVCVKK